MQKEASEVKEEKQGWGTGGCFLFWGEEDKTYAVIGRVVIGILTLGVLPLVWLIKKKKKKSMRQLAR